MWNKAFWKAVPERMIRGAAVSIAAVWFGGDFVFNSFNLNSWAEVGQIGISGAIGSLLLSLVGGAVSGNGPAFTPAEVVDPAAK